MLYLLCFFFLLTPLRPVEIKDTNLFKKLHWIKEENRTLFLRSVAMFSHSDKFPTWENLTPENLTETVQDFVHPKIQVLATLFKQSSELEELKTRIVAEIIHLCGKPTNAENTKKNLKLALTLFFQAANDPELMTPGKQVTAATDDAYSKEELNAEWLKGQPHRREVTITMPDDELHKILFKERDPNSKTNLTDVINRLRCIYPQDAYRSNNEIKNDLKEYAESAWEIAYDPENPENFLHPHAAKARTVVNAERWQMLAFSLFVTQVLFWILEPLFYREAELPEIRRAIFLDVKRSLTQKKEALEKINSWHNILWGTFKRKWGWRVGLFLAWLIADRNANHYTGIYRKIHNIDSPNGIELPIQKPVEKPEEPHQNALGPAA